jgi:anaerobic selenocysteine-containing dehydrogenase
MNTRGVMEMLAATDDTGGYVIPKIIYSDAYSSEMVAYADLILPDTTYLERHDCISLLDRPISDADGPADSIRQPVLAPDRDVRPFQDVLIDLGHRLGLPGLTKPDGSALYPGGFADYMANHERRPGIGKLAGFRGADGTAKGKGAPNPRQIDAYIANGCFWKDEIPAEARYFKHANKAYLDYAVAMGFLDKPDPIVMQLYVEPLRRFQLAAEGHGTRQPPDRLRARIKAAFDPLPIWYAPFEGQQVGDADFPLHAITQRPMIMYHAWDSQNAWQRQILSHNKLYLSRALAEAKGIAEGDRVWIISHQGRIQAEARPMEGVNGATVWTWNAIGKRKGAWNLALDAPEATRGFLLNHLISERLPDGSPLANADPVTGQAAWYDLKVRIEKCAPHETADDGRGFATLTPPPGMAERPGILRYGARFRTT